VGLPRNSHQPKQRRANVCIAPRGGVDEPSSVANGVNGSMSY
jgi:hypothetical protein